MIDIKFVGCESIEPDHFALDVPEGKYFLFLMTHTPALFWVNGELKEYPEYSGILYHPKQKVYYRTSGEKFINDYIRFDTNETFITGATLPRGVPFPIKDPDYCNKLVKLIFAETILSHEKNSLKELTIDHLMKILLNKLMESYQSSNISSQYRKLLQLRMLINNNASNDWTVARMADSLHISPGYLQSLYKSSFGISCMDDVISSRIRLAKEYLLQRNYSVTQVANLCGYNNVEHFCRQFKKDCGCTPGEYCSKAANANPEP